MRVMKIGHCCFIAEPKEGVRIMTDPGAFSTDQINAKGISAIVITHEHSDHLHIDSLKQVLVNNPEAVVITNTSVGKLLTDASIAFLCVEEGQSFNIQGITIKGFGNLHAEIYDTYGRVQNTGYMIDSLCYPGDAFHFPDAHVDILALPVAGPWMKTKDAIEYAKNIRPRIAFPIHDAVLAEIATPFWKIPDHFLSETGIVFKRLELNKEEEL